MPPNNQSMNGEMNTSQTNNASGQVININQEKMSEISGTSWLKMGFFSGLGSGLSIIIFMIIALLFFIPGLLIVLKEVKKNKKLEKEDKKYGMMIFGFVLMFIGGVISMGFLLGPVIGMFSGQASEMME